MTSKRDRILKLIKKEDPFERRVLKFIVIVAVFSVPSVFFLIFVSPIHEVGHYLTCLILGVPVQSISWNQVMTKHTQGWTATAIGFSGGYFQAGLSFLLYMISYRLSGWNLEKKLMKPSVGLVYRIALSISLIEGVVTGSLEGFFHSIYIGYIVRTELETLLYFVAFLAGSVIVHQDLVRDLGKALRLKVLEVKQQRENMKKIGSQ